MKINIRHLNPAKDIELDVEWRVDLKVGNINYIIEDQDGELVIRKTMGINDRINITPHTSNQISIS